MDTLFIVEKTMVYRIYKIARRIGTGMEKIEGSLTELQNASELSGDQIPLAAFDTETNTIHVFDDKIVDVTSLVQKLVFFAQPLETDQ